MTIEIIHNRIAYKPNTTLGEVFLPAPRVGRFCYILEDTVRPFGIKVKKHTAIPEGTYNVGIRNSPKYNNVLVLYNKIVLKNNTPVYVIESNGVQFEYILIHGGNTHEHTDGCLLTAHSVITNENEYRIFNKASDELLDAIKPYIQAGDTVLWKITNKPQSE